MGKLKKQINAVFFEKPRISTNLESISISELKRLVSTQPYTGLELLCAISRIANEVDGYRPTPDVFVPASISAFATIVSLGCKGRIDEIGNVPLHVINGVLDHAAASDGLRYNLCDDIMTINPASEPFLIICRVKGLQTILQGELLHRLVRFAYINGIVNVSTPSYGIIDRPFFPGDHDFTLGHMQEVFTFLFWMMANTKHGLTFTIENLIAAANGNMRLEDAIRWALPRLSFSAEEAKQHEIECRSRHIVGFSIPFDLFARKPFLKLDGNLFLRMPSAFIRLAASHGLFYLFRQFLLRERSRGDRHSAEDTLAQIGKRFEVYCFELLKECLPDMQAYSELYYNIDRSMKSPDGVYYRGKDRYLVIMQAKLKPPTAGLLLGDVSINIDENDLNNAYAEMFCESVSFLSNIRRLAERNTVAPEASNLAQIVIEARKILMISIAPTIPPVFHWGPGREKLLNSIEACLKQKSLDLFSEYKSLLDRRVLHDCCYLCDPEPFELHSYKKKGFSILSDIQNWWDGVNSGAEKNVGNGIPVDFFNYQVQVSGIKQPDETCFVGTLWKTITDTLDIVLR